MHEVQFEARVDEQKRVFCQGRADFFGMRGMQKIGCDVRLLASRRPLVALGHRSALYQPICIGGLAAQITVHH
jgi:hypothetical protein